MTIWKICGGKRSWPNLRHYFGICLEEPMEIRKNLPEFPITRPRFEAEIETGV
jgi:hypothetical protein